MATEPTEPKKEPILKDVREFENSYHFTRIMRDTVVALEVRVANDGPGVGVSPDLIKIDARNGDGLLMDYDVNLNMKRELIALHPYCGRPQAEVAYYMSMEQSPVGGMRLSQRQWLRLLKGRGIDDLEGVPVSQEVREACTEWLTNLHVRLLRKGSTETLVQGTIDEKLGERGEGTSKVGEARWEVVPLESVDMAALEVD